MWAVLLNFLVICCGKKRKKSLSFVVGSKISIESAKKIHISRLQSLVTLEKKLFRWQIIQIKIIIYSKKCVKPVCHHFSSKWDRRKLQHGWQSQVDNSLQSTSLSPKNNGDYSSVVSFLLYLRGLSAYIEQVAAWCFCDHNHQVFCFGKCG